MSVLNQRRQTQFWIVCSSLLLAQFFACAAFAEDVPRFTIATKRFGGVQLMSIGIDGKTPEQLTSEPEDATQPTWSPDGTKLAYVIGPRLQGKIKIMDDDGKNAHLLMDDDSPQRTPQWSPDGKQLVFSMRDKGNRNFNIFVVHADGTGLKNLTDAARFSADPAWSPDGNKIAYASNRPGARIRLWLMNADGSEQTDVLGRDLYHAVYPTWSPDGKQIVYGAADETGQCQVMQVNIDGKGDTALTQGPKPYSYAAWSPDGQYLAYVSDPGAESGDLCIYDVLAGEHRTVLSGEVFQELFRDARPSWVPKRAAAKSKD